MSGNVNKIRIKIDELVFTGFDNVDRNGIIYSIQHDLAQMIQTKGLPSLGKNGEFVANLQISPISVNSMHRGYLGKKVAASVYDGLNGVNSGHAKNKIHGNKF